MEERNKSKLIVKSSSSWPGLPGQSSRIYHSPDTFTHSISDSPSMIQLYSTTSMSPELHLAE